MKDRYRLVRRGNRFYAVDRQTLTRESLGTNDILTRRQREMLTYHCCMFVAALIVESENKT